MTCKQGEGAQEKGLPEKFFAPLSGGQKEARRETSGFFRSIVIALKVR